MTPEQITRAIAAMFPFSFTYHGSEEFNGPCVFCDRNDRHEDDCVWLAAVEWVKGRDES